MDGWMVEWVGGNELEGIMRGLVLAGGAGDAREWKGAKRGGCEKERGGGG